MLNIINYLLNPQYIDLMTEMMNVIKLLNDETTTEKQIIAAWKKVQKEYKKKNFISYEVEIETAETLDQLQFQVKVAIEKRYIRKAEANQ